MVLPALLCCASAADAELLIFHRQGGHAPIPAALQTSVSCQITGSAMDDEDIDLFDGPVDALLSPPISLSPWLPPAAPEDASNLSWNSPHFMMMRLECTIEGPFFAPPQTYHSVLDFNSHFWRVHQLQHQSVPPATDRRVVLIIEDSLVPDPAEPDGLRRRVCLRGSVWHIDAEGTHQFLGTYHTVAMHAGSPPQS